MTTLSKQRFSELRGLFVPRTVVLDTDVTHAQSNTTLSDITGLRFPISSSATAVYWFDYYLRMSAANATVDGKLGWGTMPTGATMEWGPWAPAANVTGVWAGFATTAASPNPFLAATSTYVFGSFAGNFAAAISGWVYGGGTGGQIQAQFAQNTSDASDLKVLKYSFLRWTQLVA